MNTTYYGKKICDICGEEITDVLYDAKIQEGGWATLCESCWESHGVGLGRGTGQKYVMNDSGEFKLADGYPLADEDEEEDGTGDPMILLQKAERGNAEAQYALGCAYSQMYELGLIPDNSDAVKWFRKAAKQGHAEAQYALDTFYTEEDEETEEADDEPEA